MSTPARIVLVDDDPDLLRLVGLRPVPPATKWKYWAAPRRR